jgi:hypothetical protein
MALLAAMLFARVPKHHTIDHSQWAIYLPPTPQTSVHYTNRTAYSVDEISTHFGLSSSIGIF